MSSKHSRVRHTPEEPELKLHCHAKIHSLRMPPWCGTGVLTRGQSTRGMGVEENPRHSQQGWRVRNVKVKANSKGKVHYMAKIFLARIPKSLD